MLLVALSLNAVAGDLSVRWDAPLPLHAEVLVDAPNALTLLATKNSSARALQLSMVLDITCTGTPRKKGWSVMCDVDGATLAGKALPGEQDKLDKILAEYVSLLTPAKVQMEIAPDGRVTLVDIEGISTADARASAVNEAIRQIVRRALAPLDLQMPKDGVDPGKDWKQGGSPLALDVLVDRPKGDWTAMSSSGVAGGSAVKHHVTGRKGDVVSIDTSGTGSTLIGEAGPIIQISLGGDARFDAARGQLLYRMLVIDGLQSAASSMANSSGFFHSAGAIGYRHPDGSFEGPDGVIGAPTGP